MDNYTANTENSLKESANKTIVNAMSGNIAPRTSGMKQNSLLNYGVKMEKKVPIVIDIESDEKEEGQEDGIKIKKISPLHKPITINIKQSVDKKDTMEDDPIPQKKFKKNE